MGKYWKLGDTLMMGKMKQGGTEKEPIEWTVLATEGNKMLVISSKILELKKWNDDLVDTSWKTSPVREWLNHTFYKSVFQQEEKQNIEVSTIFNGKTVTGFPLEMTVLFDRLFLLSMEEAMIFFKDASHRQANSITTVSEGEKVSERDLKTWALRTQGDSSAAIAYVDQNGEINMVGEPVDSLLGKGIRPVMWITMPEE